MHKIIFFPEKKGVATLPKIFRSFTQNTYFFIWPKQTVQMGHLGLHCCSRYLITGIQRENGSTCKVRVRQYIKRKEELVWNKPKLLNTNKGADRGQPLLPHKLLLIISVKVFRINPEFRILRLTFHGKSASKC